MSARDFRFIGHGILGMSGVTLVLMMIMVGEYILAVISVVVLLALALVIQYGIQEPSPIGNNRRKR